jgi:proline iminopeptidase
MNYSIAFPERVAALVLADSGPVRYASAAAISDNMLLRLSPEQRAAAQSQPSFQTMLPGYFYDADKAKTMIAEFRPESFHEKVGQLLAADEMAPGMDLRPGLEQLSIPALVIAGRQDPMDPAMQYEIHLALKKSQLELLDRCGHFAWLEQPEGFYKAIRQFLAARL